MKTELTQLIDAFALAHGTGNARLIQMAAEALRFFLDGVKILPMESNEGRPFEESEAPAEKRSIEPA